MVPAAAHLVRRPGPRVCRRVRLVGLALLGLLAGCAAPVIRVTVPRIETLHLTDRATPRREVDRALSKLADDYAAARPGAQAWRGQGLSMEPLIAADAWIVTEVVPFSQLTIGQVVLFRNRRGRLVAHALVKFTSRGWVTAGVNNEAADRELLTMSSYIGVVTAAFVTD